MVGLDESFAKFVAKFAGRAAPAKFCEIPAESSLVGDIPSTFPMGERSEPKKKCPAVGICTIFHWKSASFGIGLNPENQALKLAECD